MSHALKTPLNAILGFSELGERATEDPTLTMYFSTIRSAGTRLLDMLNDLLDFSRAQRGDYTPAISWFSVPEFLDELISAWQGDAREKDIQLRQINGQAQWCIESDPTILRRVFGRLISNAIQYSPDGGVIEVRLHIAPDHTGSRGILHGYVVDQGNGIPEAIRANLFTGLEPGEKGQSRGPGLGLALSRVLLELVKGTIELESSSSAGSTFAVSLPVGLRELDAEFSPAQTATAAAVGSLKGRVILIADDTEINRTMLREMLSHTGARLIEVTNGQEAVEAAAGSSIDAVLLDIEMPVLDGWDAAQALREQDGPGLPLVAVSGHDLASDPRSDRFDALLQKPLDQESLLACLLRILPADAEDLERTVEATPDSGDELSAPALNSEARASLLATLKGASEEVLALRSNQSITLIETFGQRMANLAGKEGFEPLATWGHRLAREASMFEIDRMNRTLDRFESFIQILEGDHD